MEVPNLDALTARQLDVARLVADDLTNREIAERLGISLETVKQHVSGAMLRVEVSRREELGDWYHAKHRGGVRQLRELALTPLGLVGLGVGVATLAIVVVVVIALVGSDPSSRSTASRWRRRCC